MPNHIHGILHIVNFAGAGSPHSIVKKIQLSPNAGHTIKIVHTVSRIEAYLNGKKLLEMEDSVFSKAGGVGIWTKADASTYFDDFRIISVGGGK